MIRLVSEVPLLIVIVGLVGDLIEELDLALETHVADSRMCRSSEAT